MAATAANTGDHVCGALGCREPTSVRIVLPEAGERVVCDMHAYQAQRDRDAEVIERVA